MIEKVKEQVRLILGKDETGHDMEHIERVLLLSLKFAEEENDVDKDLVALIALLHDVDDYKLFGTEYAYNLNHTKAILECCSVEEEVKDKVFRAVRTIGYKKMLNGIKPSTREEMIVSDADMCDIIGANGILRTYKYHQKNSSPFFDRNFFPVENITYEKYKLCAKSGVCHIFEKTLKLKNIMYTPAGKKEAEYRQKIVVDFLYHLFQEEGATDWITYLDEFLDNN